MQIAKLSIFILVSLLLVGCMSTESKTGKAYTGIGLSAGGTLLLDSKILSREEFQAMIDASNAQSSESNASFEHTAGNPLADSDFLFGSGLVSATVVFAQTGAFVNPGHFMNRTDLAFFALNFLLDNSMQYHPTMYDYHFVKNCDSVICVEDKLIAYGRDFLRAYLAHPRIKSTATNLRIAPIEEERSSWIANTAEVAVENEHDTVDELQVFGYVRMPFVAEINNGIFWGNKKPRDYPDGFYARQLDTVEAANLLIEVSKQHPDTYTYIAIDRQRLEEGKPCFGGFFINNGTAIPVEELNCVRQEKTNPPPG